MIIKLRKSINIILFSFLSIIIVLVSIAFMYTYIKTESRRYNANLSDIVHDEGFSTFLDGEDVDDLEYCSFHRQNYSSPFYLSSNNISNLSDEEAIEICRDYEYWKKNNFDLYRSNDYRFIKRRNSLIMFSKQPLNDSVRFTTIVVVVIDLILLLGLFYFSRLQSQKIIKPIEENERKQKEFISNTSHELKTPLTIIMSNIEILEKEIGANEKTEYISSEAQRMKKLINNMMELNDISNNHVEKSKVNLSNAVLSVSLPFESIAYDSNKKYEIDVCDGIYVNGNYEQLQSLASILIDNAFAYSFDNGTIKISLFCKGNKCYFQVSNQGNEISSESINLIFDRFYRIDEARADQGNHFGLGLSIASEIVKTHNGKIFVTSENNINTFTVVFKKHN